MRYRLLFSLFATVIALCIGLPAVSSGSGPAIRPEDQLQQPGNTLCRAALSATHRVSGFPMLLRILSGSDSELSVPSLDKWIRILGPPSANSRFSAPTSRIEPNVAFAALAQTIDVS